MNKALDKLLEAFDAERHAQADKDQAGAVQRAEFRRKAADLLNAQIAPALKGMAADVAARGHFAEVVVQGDVGTTPSAMLRFKVRQAPGITPFRVPSSITFAANDQSASFDIRVEISGVLRPVESAPGNGSKPAEGVDAAWVEKAVVAFVSDVLRDA